MRTSQGVGAVLLLAVTAGSAVYAVVVSVLARWPTVLRMRGSGGAARPLLVAAVTVPLAVAGIALGWRSRGHRPATRYIVALSCVGLGVAWVVWGVVEQHLVRTFDVAPGAGAAEWDALFHGVGVVTAGLGTSILSAGGATGRGT